MNPRALVSALYSVEVVLREADVVRPGQRITLQIPPEAGARLEEWLLRDPPEEIVYGHREYIDGGERKRTITLSGITVWWPAKSFALPHEAPEHQRHDELGIFDRQSMFDRRVPRYDAEDFSDRDESSGC